MGVKTGLFKSLNASGGQLVFQPKRSHDDCLHLKPGMFRYKAGEDPLKSTSSSQSLSER